MTQIPSSLKSMARKHLEPKIMSAAEGALQKLQVPIDDADRAVVSQILDDVFGPASSSGGARGRGPGALVTKALTDTKLSPQERRAQIAHAMGEPLTDAIVNNIRDLYAFLPEGAWEKGGAVAGDAMDSAFAKRLETTWMAPLLPRGDMLRRAGEALAGLKQRVDDPRFRDDVAQVLSLVRAFGRVEAQHLANLAIDVGPEKKPAVDAAMRTYLQDVIRAAVSSAVPPRSPLAPLAAALVDVGSAHTATEAGGDRAERLVHALEQLATQTPATPTPTLPPAKLVDQLDAAGAKLRRALQDAGAMTPAAADALGEITADISAILSTAAHAMRFAGALKNPDMPPAERAEVLKHAAKDAGPIFVKVLQTIMNQGSVKGEKLGDDVVMNALRELQDRVPEMSDAEVRAQVEKGLGKPIDAAFVSFDMKPIASASIAQVHRAQIKLRWGGVRNVVVKVQRPHLAAEFERTARVLRFALNTVREALPELQAMTSRDGKPLLDLDADVSFNPQDIIRLLDATLSSFVESFAIEVDFVSERKNLKKFRRDMRTHNFITAPYVFRRFSSDTILTMEEMRFESIASLVDRAARANAARSEAAPTGPLPVGDDAAAQALAVRKARHHLAVTYGIDAHPEAFEVVRNKSKQWVITGATLEASSPAKENGEPHRLFPQFQLSVGDDGVVHDVIGWAPLNAEDVRKTRDRFTASLLSQVLVHGRAHGDPHKKNWGILADGKTVVMLDFGKIIEIKGKHLTAPFKFALAYYRRNLDGMADAVFSMTQDKHTVKVSDEAAAKAKLRASLETLFAQGTSTDGKGKVPRPEMGELLGAITAAAASAGLGLASVYTQGIKVAFSYGGNYEAFKEAGAGNHTLGGAGRAVKIAAGDALDSLTLGVVGGVMKLRKDARVQGLNKKPKPFT